MISPETATPCEPDPDHAVRLRMARPPDPPADNLFGEEMDELEDRYLAPASAEFPRHREDSGWTPLIDGVAYFGALADTLDPLKEGDVLLVSAFHLLTEIDLRGREPGDPDYLPIGEVFARAAARGVDVRLLIAGGAPANLPKNGIGPFRENLVAARALRRWVPEGEPDGAYPLDGRVLLDWSGHPVGSNHQKFVVVRHRGELTAFVGGIDITRWRFDAAPHDRQRVRGRRWGWHDAAQRITGAATVRVWDVFRARWREAASLPRRFYWLPPEPPGLFNPPPLVNEPGPPPPVAPCPTPGKTLQVARSFGPNKRGRGIKPTPSPWTLISNDGVQEVFRALSTAIDAAERYVYIEDQYFREYPATRKRFGLYPHICDAAERGVKVIFVSGGVENNARRSPSRLSVSGRVKRDITAALSADASENFAFFRIRNLTVHSKLTLIDDRFACIGSANFFTRSMAGVDHELSVVVVDAGDDVRDLRVRLWAEHLRIDPADDLAFADLRDLGTALGAWQPGWGDAIDPLTGASPLLSASMEQVLLPVRTDAGSPGVRR